MTQCRDLFKRTLKCSISIFTNKLSRHSGYWKCIEHRNLSWKFIYGTQTTIFHLTWRVIHSSEIIHMLLFQYRFLFSIWTFQHAHTYTKYTNSNEYNDNAVALWNLTIHAIYQWIMKKLAHYQVMKVCKCVRPQPFKDRAYH